MNGKPEAIQERGLIETNFAVGERARLLALPRKKDPGLVWKLKPIPEPPKGISFQRALFLESVERSRRIKDRRVRR